MTYEQAHKFLEVKQREMTKNRGLYNEIEMSINGKAITVHIAVSGWIGRANDGNT